jgi:hypothetical protein
VVVDSLRPNLKVAAGSHVGNGTFGTYRKVNINLFGDSQLGTTVTGFYLSGASAYKLRDLTVDGQFDAASQTSTDPLATLDAQRVTFRGIVTLTRCRTTFVNVGIEGLVDFCAIYLSGSAGFEGAELIMKQSEIKGAYCGVSLVDSSKLEITNSVFRDQLAGGAISWNDVDVLPSSVSFSTFYNTTWNCPDGTVLFASRNNLFLNEKAGAPANTVTGTQCVHNYDMIKPQANAPAGANNVLGADPQFVNKTAGDFHLAPTSPAIDTADPSATELVDFDGTARPQGAKRDIGAFEYKP